MLKSAFFMVTEIVWYISDDILTCRDEVRHLSHLMPCINGNEALSHCDTFNLDENVKLLFGYDVGVPRSLRTRHIQTVRD